MYVIFRMWQVLGSSQSVESNYGEVISQYNFNMSKFSYNQIIIYVFQFTGGKKQQNKTLMVSEDLISLEAVSLLRQGIMVVFRFILKMFVFFGKMVKISTSQSKGKIVFLKMPLEMHNMI